MSVKQAARVNGHVSPGNPSIRAFGVANKVCQVSRPARTLLSAAGATGTPLIMHNVTVSKSNYAESIAQTLPKDAPPKCDMRLAEFFCCGGGVGLGFRSAGFELAFANDINSAAAATYAHNLGHTPVVGDIRSIHVRDHVNGEIDVLMGGFPCVTFSHAGNKLGVVDDIYGKLYMELCRVIREVRPRYFVAENVRGILSANNGQAVKLVLLEFLRLGYRTSYELVNMAEHGVPQTRQRVVFMGVREDQWRGSFRFPARTHRLHDDKAASRWLSKAVSLREAIGDLPDPGDLLPVLPKAAPNQSCVPQGSSLRRMTVRECARVQSFPDWFEFQGSQSARYAQVGNAVPPLYAYKLAMAVVHYDVRRLV